MGAKGFTSVVHTQGRGGCPQEGTEPPLHPPRVSPQCGEGTPQTTGFFEVTVAGKLVHSKKVRVSPLWGQRMGWAVVNHGAQPIFVCLCLPREAMASWTRKASFGSWWLPSKPPWLRASVS